jgi:arsenate reductase
MAGSTPELEYWHNPRCSKSRAGKELLDNAGATYKERRYLDEPPTAEELDQVLKALGKEPWDIARMGEDVAKQFGLASLPHDRDKWIEIMVANPILIERPILVTGDGRAAVGRPTEALEPLI